MKRIISLWLVLLFCGLANAHEFWMKPQKFRFAAGEQVVVDLMVGENFSGEFWDLTRHKVEKLEVVNLHSKRDLTTQVKNTRGKNFTYKLQAEGTHMVALQSNAAFIELKAEDFNSYLAEDGIENIRDLRKSKNEENSSARELYTRYAKLILHCGAKRDDVYKKVLGLKHEIIPLSNPLGLKSGDYMECKVLFNGEPAQHQLVKVWNIVGNRTFLQNIFTENDGTLKFPISNAGPWMVSTVRMEPSEKSEADYESSWASLVFGIE